MKKSISVILCFVMLISISVPTLAVDSNSISSLKDSVGSYLYTNIPAPQVGSVGGEWAIIGLSRSGLEIPDEYYEKYYQAAERYVKEKDGILHDRKYTEYSRLILALSSIGKNPADIMGYNLLTPVGDYEKTIWQGINGAIWALIALDSKNYDMPVCEGANVQATREMYTDYILSVQNEDGGFSLSANGASDADVTAMAISALSNYTHIPEVSETVDSALLYLSSIQGEDGGFTGISGNSCESNCQVIIALCSLGIKTEDPRFVKNGKSPVDALLSYRTKDGGFTHSLSSDKTNLMATEQAMCAIAAIYRMEMGKTKLYDMTDVSSSGNVSVQTGLSGKNADVKYMPVIYPDKTFDDIESSIYKNEITDLAKRNIINGQSETLFNPSATMTRAEFAAITVKALGLPLRENKLFSDVSDTDWHYKYISTAYAYGIVNGVSDTHFDPNALITREQASVMVTRAAVLCGINPLSDTDAAKNILSQFDDYRNVSDWALCSLAFCCDENIISADEMTIRPQENVKRDEIAYMLYNMLKLANLTGE